MSSFRMINGADVGHVSTISADYGLGPESGSRGTREGQLMQDLNAFGEFPNSLTANFQAVNQTTSTSPKDSQRDPRMDGHYLTKMGAPYEQKYDFEDAHFDETHRKFSHIVKTHEDKAENASQRSQRRNSDSSFSGIEIEDLLQFTRYENAADEQEYFDQSARRVQSMPYPGAVDRVASNLNTRSVDTIYREQQQMVRQSQKPQPQHQQPYYPAPAPQAAMPNNNKSMADPRQYMAESYQSYESPYPKRYNVSAVPSGYDSAVYNNAGRGQQGQPGQGIASAPPAQQTGGFLSRLPAMFGGGRQQYTASPSMAQQQLQQQQQHSSPPLLQRRLSPPSYGLAPANNLNTNGEFENHPFQGNHQLMQQSRGGITTAGGGLLNLSASRGQLLIGSNQGRGVYSEKSSTNLIGAGLYEGTGTVYVVQLKCQYRHYVLDARAPQYLKTGDFVIVDADRGEDLGIIIELLPMMAFVERQRSMPISLEDEQNEVGRILREASVYEREQLPGKYQDELMVIELCKNLSLNTYQMQMVVVDAEYQFDRHKLTVYYDSAIRIDFRELVRDLFAAFKTRIWFKKANNRYFKAKQYALMALATGDAGIEDWQQQQQQR